MWIDMFLQDGEGKAHSTNRNSITNRMTFHYIMARWRQLPVLATWHIRSQNCHLRLFLLSICLVHETRKREKHGCSSATPEKKPQLKHTRKAGDCLENARRKVVPKMGCWASTGIFSQSSVIVIHHNHPLYYWLCLYRFRLPIGSHGAVQPGSELQSP